MSILEQKKKFLDPKTFALISNYRLIARLIVDGFFMGLHAGPRHAFSLEYSRHRDYYPGDPLKLIDWKLYGKTDRFFVKQFEEETTLQAWLVLDSSKSMSYTGKQTPVSKLKYASYLAAAFSHMLLKQRDATGLMTFDNRLRKLILPSSSGKQLDIILKELQHLEAGGSSHFEQAASLAANRIKRRGLIVLFSDFLEAPEKIEKTLKQFLARGNELIVFHILTFEELNFSFRRFSFFEDMETHQRILLNPRHFKGEYVEKMAQYLNTIRKICGRLKVSYQLLDTMTPLDQALRMFLKSRERVAA